MCRTIRLPFPSTRLANIALQALSVDEELSPLVRRCFSLDSHRADYKTSSDSDPAMRMNVSPLTGGVLRLGPDYVGARNASEDGQLQKNVLVVEYRATTNRMLRVSVNGFFESVGVIISSMRELDEDVIGNEWVGEGNPDIDDLIKVQGLQEVGVI